MTPEKQQQLETLLLEQSKELGGSLFIGVHFGTDMDFHLCQGQKSIKAGSLDALIRANNDYNPERQKQLKIERLKAELAELTKDAA